MPAELLQQPGYPECFALLPFYRTHNHSFYKISLQKRISCHNRQGGQKNLRAFYGSVGDQRHCLPVRGAVDGGVPLDNNGLQIALQGILCGFVHEDDAVKPGIPVINKCEQADGGNAGLGQRHIDPGHDIPVACSVHESGLLQLLRYRPEKIQHQHHAEYGHCSRKHQRPDGSQQMHALNRHVPWDKSRIDQHGNKKEPGIYRAQLQLAVILGQRIGYKDAHDDVQRYAQQAPDHRHPKGFPEGRPFCHVFIGFQGKIHRQQLHQPGCGRGIGAEGNRQDIDQGKDADQRQEGENQGIDNCKNTGTHGFSDLHTAFLCFCIHFHKACPSVFTLKDPVIEKFICNIVGYGNEETGYGGFEHAHCRRRPELRVNQADAVDKRINNIAGLIHLRAVEVQNLIKPGVQYISQGKHTHEHNDHPYARQCHMPHFLEAVRAVHRRGLIQAEINSGDGGEINHRTEAEALPDIRHDDSGLEPFIAAQEENGIYSKEIQDLIQDTLGGRKNIYHNASKNDPGQEVRKIYGCLHCFPEFIGTYFI